jgi:hypothetical protein
MATATDEVPRQATSPEAYTRLTSSGIGWCVVRRYLGCRLVPVRDAQLRTVREHLTAGERGLGG